MCDHMNIASREASVQTWHHSIWHSFHIFIYGLITVSSPHERIIINLSIDEQQCVVDGIEKWQQSNHQ